MKNRNTIITTILLALGVFALSQQVQSATDTPDPGGSLPVSNTADGQNALRSVTTGIYNSAFGFDSLLSLTGGKFCTGVGGATLLSNTADENTAVGAGALLSNTTGDSNTANGAFALFSNTEGAGNTANGDEALLSNTIGLENTANGGAALFSNSSGNANTATGAAALLSNTIGNFNTADGFGVLTSNISGNGNTAIGRDALSATTGDGNTALGANAGSALTAGNLNIDIGVDVIGMAGESNTIRIGANLDDTQGASACHIGGIYNQLGDPATMTAVGIDATGKLATVLSSRRFKRDIKPMNKASEAILSLKPVTFHYKSDAKNTPCFGLIAEEVAEVNPNLVVRDENGKVNSVRYEQVNAMLLNEFLKEHRKVHEQQTTIGQLKSDAAKQEATISELKSDLQIVVARLKDQDSKIQKVSDEMELSRSAPRMVLSNP